MKKTSPKAIAVGALLLAIGGLVPVAAANPAAAKSCKWVLVASDPATGSSTWVCSTRRI